VISKNSNLLLLAFQELIENHQEVLPEVRAGVAAQGAFPKKNLSRMRLHIALPDLLVMKISIKAACSQLPSGGMDSSSFR
jgi:hypothetical protein